MNRPGYLLTDADLAGRINSANILGCGVLVETEKEAARLRSLAITLKVKAPHIRIRNR